MEAGLLRSSTSHARPCSNFLQPFLPASWVVRLLWQGFGHLYPPKGALMGPKVPTGDILRGRTRLGRQQYDLQGSAASCLTPAFAWEAGLWQGQLSAFVYTFPHSTITASGPGNS